MRGRFELEACPFCGGAAMPEACRKTAPAEGPARAGFPRRRAGTGTRGSVLRMRTSNSLGKASG